MLNLPLRFLLIASPFIVSFPVKSEIIYDDTQFIISGYATEKREYGDQLDLEGTARTLTELTFKYFGDFKPDGDETMKVRLYSNENTYDSFRKAPTTLLYESGNMFFLQGYNTRTISGLNVRLPLDTVTLTIEFKGLKTNEVAGLLLYSPPTVGSSFNEFWGRLDNGGWAPFFYSTTDFSRRANAGIQLVARADALLDQQQTNSNTIVSLRSATNVVQLAQTFVARTNGRLDHVTLDLNFTQGPVHLSILDAVNGAPGTNLLGEVLISSAAAGAETASFYDQAIFLAAGKQYAIACSLQPATNGTPVTLAAGTGNPYSDGQLWSRSTGNWQRASAGGTATNLDAAFSVWLDPANPAVRISSPRAGAEFAAGQPLKISAEVTLTNVYRVRFFDGDLELGQVTKTPAEQVNLPLYELVWPNPPVGQHSFKLVLEDQFRRPFRSEKRTVTVRPAERALDHVVSATRRFDGSVALEFDTTANQPVTIQYSDDLRTWQSSNAPVPGDGSRVSYVDDGPPKTASHPSDAKYRFYRLIFGP